MPSLGKIKLIQGRRSIDYMVTAFQKPFDHVNNLLIIIKLYTCTIRTNQSMQRNPCHSVESIIDLNTATGTFTMHDLMWKCATSLYSMAKTDADFQQLYGHKLLNQRLKDYMLGFLKAETCRVIASGSLYELNRSQSHRFLLTYLLDIATSRTEHNILLEGRHVVRKMMAAELRVSRHYALLKQLLEEDETDPDTSSHEGMLALCYMELSVAEMEMDEYAAARDHLGKVFLQLHVDYTLKEPPQEDDAIVAEAFLYYAVSLDNLSGDHQHMQRPYVLACLERSREMFKRLADCAEAAGGAEAQGQQVSLRSQEASVLMQMSLHWFRYWKEISGNIDVINSSARGSPAAATDTSTLSKSAFENALGLQNTCIKLRESLRQFETLNMSLALLHHSNLLAAAGNVAHALEAARKADGIMRAVLGHDHRQTLQSTMHLANLYASELHDHK